MTIIAASSLQDPGTTAAAPTRETGHYAAAGQVERGVEEVARQVPKHVAEAALVKRGEPGGSRLAGKAFVAEREADGQDLE